MTTIVGIRKDNLVVIAGDGQASFGNTVMKSNVKKIRRLGQDSSVISGFAGSTADAFALFERLEGKLDQYKNQLMRACVELAKDWRSDKYLRRLEAMMIVADKDVSLLLSGTGDVIESDDGILAIGSGGPYANSAAKALIKNTNMNAKEVALESLNIASEICVYTNHNIVFEEIKNKFQGIVIGLSGGIDSALTLCIAADALGPENVKALIMPSRYTSKMSIDDASMLAKKLNVSYEIISIEPPFTSFLDILKPIFGNLPIDATEENIQARCRGLLLMAISNKYNKLVLTTGNKSEMSVGYATLYGDMAGGFSPLKDVWKTLVYKLSKWRNTQGNVIPESIINRPPTAELRDNQLDQDFLPDYEILDLILEKYIELDQHPEKIISDGYNPETVYKVTKLVDKNEYKRRQSAPGIRITNKAFGKDRRYPISSGYTEEK